MPSPEAAASELQDRATLWSVGEIPASDVVSAACDALVAGLDSPGLTIAGAVGGPGVEGRMDPLRSMPGRPLPLAGSCPKLAWCHPPRGRIRVAASERLCGAPALRQHDAV